MRILQLIDTLNIGGAERMSVNIANVLAENSIESYLVASRKGGPLQQYLIPSVQFYELEKKSGLDIAGFYRLIRLVNKIKPHIIHAHSTSVYWTIGIKVFRKKCKVVWHDHYGQSDILKDNDRFWLRLLSKWIDAVIVVNYSLEVWCKRNLNIPENKITYLKNFPYLALSKPRNTNKKTILLNLANFRPQKDQLTLLEAAYIVKQTGIDFELWLAGAHVDKKWLITIQTRIENLGMGNEVKILGPVDNPSEVLLKASIGILSSISEGLPVALLEYGLAGLPVICTDTGQCKQVLGEGKFGIVIPPGDATALADAIIHLFSNPAEASQMAIVYKNHVRKEYGAENFIVDYLKIVHKVLE